MMVGRAGPQFLCWIFTAVFVAGMKRIPIKSLSILLIFGMIGACDSQPALDPEGPEPPAQAEGPAYPVEPAGQATFTVHWADRSSSVHVAPFDDITQSRVVSPSEGSWAGGRFSPEGHRVLHVGVHPYPGYAHLTDLVSGSTTSLRDQGGTPILPEMDTVVWMPGGSRFYYDQRASISGQPMLRRYSLLDSSAIRLRHEVVASTRIGLDTLVAGLFGANVGFRSLRYLDLDGATIGVIPLDSLGDFTVSTGLLYSPSWNPARRLMAFVVSDADDSNSGIGISDLKGTGSLVAITPDGLVDRRPRWGPNGLLVFDRSEVRDGDLERAKLMSFDFDTGALSDLLSGTDLPGATGVSHFDWTPRGLSP